MLNASRSGAGVSNALPYYLLLIGSAFVGLLRCALLDSSAVQLIIIITADHALLTDVSDK